MVDTNKVLGAKKGNLGKPALSVIQIWTLLAGFNGIFAEVTAEGAPV